MKKITKILCFLLGVIVLLGTTAGCSRRGGQEQIRKGATQLYVSNYDGGVGTDWLRDIKTRFEEQYATTSFEKGKVGVQIVIDPNKTEGSEYTFDTTVCEVAFTEKVTSKLFLTEDLMDLTDVLEYILSQNGVSLDSNIINAIKVFDGKVRAIPHYEGGGGIIYDKDLFNQKAFYIDKKGAFTNASGDLSVGPDGIANTSDDGLPATIEELLNLFAQIKRRSCDPIIISGLNRNSYSSLLLDRITASYEGRTAMEANYKCEGDNITYITDINKDVSSLFGYSITKNSADITNENAYLLKQQVGKFYALGVLESIIKNKDYDTKGWTSTTTHLDAQELFIKSIETSEPIAMLIDGTWWENEASDAFKRMAAKNSKYSKENRNFGWMPMPTKATSTDTNVNGDGLLTLNSLAAYAFAKDGVSAEKKELIKTFLKFVYSNENMEKFTEITGATRPFTYTISEETKQNLTPFQKEVVSLHENNKYVYTHSDSQFFTANESTLFTNRWRGELNVNAVISFFSDHPVSLKDYFKDLWISQTDWNNKYLSAIK